MQKNRRVDIAIVYKSGMEAINVKKEEKGKASAAPPTDPFGESKLLIPAKEYKVFKEINNIPEYRIGPGDTLSVTFWEGIKENTYKVSLSPQGEVSFS